MIYSIIGLFVFLGIGYATLSTHLNILGSLTVNKYDPPTLYNVFRDLAEGTNYAREYTGNHHDSFTEEPSHKIYTWRDSPDALAASQKFNVIFAGYCWQMIRTTDTGGVKMVYNGEVENNQCLSSRGTHSGYNSRTSVTLSGNYWYGTDYTYDSSLHTYKVSGTTEQVTLNSTSSSDLIGKYTCASTNVDNSCSTLYYVESYNNNSDAYVIQIKDNTFYASIGTLPFSVAGSMASAGYMYNTVYHSYHRNSISTEYILSSSTFSSGKWFADSVTWGNPVADVYNLNNPYQVSSISDTSLILGKYTFFNSSQSYTRRYASYITNIVSNKLYYLNIRDTLNHTLADNIVTYTYGDSYTDNGNGTYTINNPTTVQNIDWYSNAALIGEHKYICKNAVNNTCSDVWYTTTVGVEYFDYVSSSSIFKFSNGFTWDGSNYILDDDTAVSLWNMSESNNMASLSNAHYTCFNTTGECSTLYYVYYISDIFSYSLILQNGKSVEDALYEMLHDDNVNVNDSIIKKAIELWFERNMLDYSDYLEDIIWCNNRSIESLGPYNPDGGLFSESLYFESLDDLGCPNITDQFSTLNNKARLKYKVGLLRGEEISLFWHTGLENTGQNYWANSPSGSTSGSVFGFYVSISGIGYQGFSNSYGIRPAISLKPGTLYSSGDGSTANPYIVDTN